MRAIFLADAHLVSPDDHNYRQLLQFLRQLQGTTGDLLIMGDLFDFWLGFPSNPFRQYDAVLQALFALRRSGCRLTYFEGNHDFHLGKIFREDLGAEVYAGPAVLTLQGRRLFLCHGDQINRADRGYRLLRLLLHNPVVAAAVRHVPPAAAMAIKERLQHRSRASYGAKSRRWDYQRIIETFAGEVREQGCQALVTGHFHLPFLQELQDPPFTILSLGDWMKHFTYGEMKGGELRLKSFPA